MLRFIFNKGQEQTTNQKGEKAYMYPQPVREFLQGKEDIFKNELLLEKAMQDQRTNHINGNIHL